nr:hypothetical protein [Escherichia coli]
MQEKLWVYRPGRYRVDHFLRQLVQQVSHINLLSKDWYLTEAGPEHPFYVSDNRWVLENRNDFGVAVISAWPCPAYKSICPVIDMMLAMYCPSSREQKVREKQHLLHLIARAPGSNPASCARLKCSSMSQAYWTIFLCRFLQKM